MEFLAARLKTPTLFETPPIGATHQPLKIRSADAGGYENFIPTFMIVVGGGGS